MDTTSFNHHEEVKVLCVRFSQAELSLRPLETEELDDRSRRRLLGLEDRLSRLFFSSTELLRRLEKGFCSSTEEQEELDLHHRHHIVKQSEIHTSKHLSQSETHLDRRLLLRGEFRLFLPNSSRSLAREVDLSTERNSILPFL